MQDAGVSAGNGAHENLFPFPTDARAALSCTEFHRAVATFDAHLAYAPPRASAEKIAAATSDWLDAYGFWAPVDGTVERAIDHEARALLAEVLPSGVTCVATEQLGVLLATTIAEARGRLLPEDLRNNSEKRPSLREAAALSLSPLDDEPSDAKAASPGGEKEEDARFRAAVSAMIEALGPQRGAVYRAALDTHLFPARDAKTAAGILRASLLRGWVPLVDGHGNWAPITEATSIYDTDLSDEATPRLFARAVGTVGGVRIVGGAAAPLVDGDVLVAVEPGTIAPAPAIYLAGLAPEAIDEVAVAAFSDAQVTAVPALWIHEGALRRGVIPRPDAAHGLSSGGEKSAPYILPHTDVPWGKERLLLVAIRDVHDEFGQDLRALLREERIKQPPIAGVVLDLRGNGGGSMDGALEALAAFLPDAPLFPLESRHEDSVSVDRTDTPPAAERWEGPVAALVDHDTASAAEMLAGALDAYRRGPVVGTKTFGKGCVQSFEDDHARAQTPASPSDFEPGEDPHDSIGAFRLTTYLYALPDGRAVQRRGLVPTIPFPFVVDGPIETEGNTPAAPPSYTGPDVREKSSIGHLVPFPNPGPDGLSRCLATPTLNRATCSALVLLVGKKR